MSNYLCKDCKHSRISTFAKVGSYIFEWSPPKSHWYKCAKSIEPEHDVVDPVTGPKTIKADMDYCQIQRKYGKCGTDAKYWAPKKKKDLFKMLTKEHND